MSGLFLKKLYLKDYRNYKLAEFEFHKKIIFIIGNNAIGKSNLLEAIQTLSFGTSHRAETERFKINFSEDFFSLKADYEIDSKAFQYEYTSGGESTRRRIKLNNITYSSFREIKDYILKSISFKAKESLEIVRDSPSNRRDWLDLNLCLLDKYYSENLQKYQKCLEHRNRLLKNLAEGFRNREACLEELSVWDSNISKYGFEIIKARKDFFSEIISPYKEAYFNISASKDEIPDLNYQSSIINNQTNESYLEFLESKRSEDMRRVMSCFGPHRDDFLFLLNNKEVRHYGSQGQQRSSSLALHIAQINLWKKILNHDPILLLDDVCAELDLSRQESLFANLPVNSQIFITTTHLVNLPRLENQDYQIISL